MWHRETGLSRVNPRADALPTAPGFYLPALQMALHEVRRQVALDAASRRGCRVLSADMCAVADPRGSPARRRSYCVRAAHRFSHAPRVWLARGERFAGRSPYDLSGDGAVPVQAGDFSIR